MAKKSKKRSIGTKLDYTRQFKALQEYVKDMPRNERADYYKNFYKSVAKVADQRLVELEKLSKKDGYSQVKQWAYKNAMREIRAMYGQDAKRFNRKQPDDLRRLYKNLRRVLSFLEQPTSSKSGIEEIFSKRANTINERYGTDLDWSTVGDLFESVMWKKVHSKYGSKTTLEAIGLIQQNEKEIKKAFKENKPISIHIEPDADGKKDNVLENTVNKFLRYYKKDTTKLISKI
jgi:hypothetical protein